MSVKNLPQVGLVKEIAFTDQEQRYLHGMCVSISHGSGKAESKAVWALLAKKVACKTLYSQMECDLLTKAIDSTLSAGDNVINKSEDLEAKVRAQAVMSMFRTIRTKLAFPPEAAGETKEEANGSETE